MIAIASALACGGTVETATTCTELLTPDFCPSLTVTMHYTRYASDGGVVENCAVPRAMTAAQYAYAVAPEYRSPPHPYACEVSDTSATQRSIACANTAAEPVPEGCATAACSWQPPVLH